MTAYNALVLARHLRRQAERYDDLAVRATLPDVQHLWTSLAQGARADADQVQPKETS